MSSSLVGTIEEIWVYPVSSLGGQRLRSAKLGSRGIPGDRSWCIVDAKTGLPAAPEREPRWRAALFLQSRLENDVPCIGFPNGGVAFCRGQAIEAEVGHALLIRG